MPGQTFALHIDFDSCNKIYTAQGIVQLSNKITCGLIKFTIMLSIIPHWQEEHALEQKLQQTSQV